MADISKIKLNNTEYNIKDSTARGVADTAIQSVKVNGTALTPDSNKAVDITAIPASIVSAGTLANGMTATTQTTSDDSAKVATTEFVHDVVDLLPSPMVFKGSLGTGGTITTLPTASSSNKGYVYKVITAGTYASQSAKVGDTFISDGSVWVLIPSGDEPSGTVTNVAVANGGGLTVSGSPITSSGTITVGHSNSVTAKTSSSLKKIAYDAYGHITGSSELSTAESNVLASGITSADVAQITTNKNNISNIQATVASYHKASGTDIYFSEIEPTGSITAGSYWVSTTATKKYVRSNNIINPELTFNSGMLNMPYIAFPLSSGGNRKTAFIYVEPNTTYTFGGTSCDRLIIGGWDSTKTKAELESYTVEAPLVADSNIVVYTSNVPANYTFTTSATTHMIGIFYSLNRNVTDAHLNEGTELLPYDPYVSPGWE